MVAVARASTAAMATVAAVAAVSASASSSQTPPDRPPRDLRWVERTILCVLVCAWIIYFALLADRPLVAQGVYQVFPHPHLLLSACASERASMVLEWGCDCCAAVTHLPRLLAFLVRHE